MSAHGQTAHFDRHPSVMSQFTNGRFADGTPVDIYVRDGTITNPTPTVDEVIDLGGRLVVAALAEPHAHLDKAMLAAQHPNPDGDLPGAIETMQSVWPGLDETEITERATRAVRMMVAAGTTFIRTHADTHTYAGTRSVAALTHLRDYLVDLCEIQVVSLCYPVTGPYGDEGKGLITKAITLGVDVVGGAPHLEENPAEAMDFLLVLASEAGLPVDFHVDEILDAEVDSLRDLARGTIAHGLEGRVTASHCVSHGLKSVAAQREIASALADAGVSVVTLPRTNLFLQARGSRQAPPRGTAGVEAMIEAGVLVAGGADNVQDPFYAIGRCDPLETASLLVSVCHRDVDEAFEMVTNAPRKLAGLEPVTFALDSPAEFMAIGAGTPREAMAEQPADRIVVHRGRVVAKTTVDEWVAPVDLT